MNPAEPPITMHNTIYALIDKPDIEEIKMVVDYAEKELQKYIPGYKVVLGPVYENGRITISGVWCPAREKIASDYEIPYIRIENVEEIEEKVKKVFETEGPVICEIMTPEWQSLIPRITSEKMPDGRLVAHEYSDMFPFLDRDEYKKNMIAEE